MNVHQQTEETSIFRMPWLSNLLDPKTVFIIIGIFSSVIVQWVTMGNSVSRLNEKIDLLNARVIAMEIHLNADYIPRTEHMLRDSYLDERLNRIEMKIDDLQGYNNEQTKKSH